MPRIPFEHLSFIVPVAFVLYWLAVITVHVALAIAVFRHSASLRDAGTEPVFINPHLWTLATLVSGVIGAVGYWLFHCSTLASLSPVPDASTPDASASDDVPHA